VQSSLERTLADVIAVQEVAVEAVDSALLVTVAYVVRRTQQPQVATFRAPGGGG
jgi:hypothetical protein